MIIKLLHFFCIILTSLAMGGGLGHLYALPNKMRLSQTEYLTAQQAYRGWELLGIPIIGALILLIILAIFVRRDSRTFFPILGALICIGLGLADFFIYTYPANQSTVNWTILPEKWHILRRQWEYSHAAGALLNFSAFILLLIPLFTNKKNRC
jgi:hypothetical protein